jgi:hypothetical protein
MTKRIVTLLLATLASSLTAVSPLCADTVWVSKDCSVTPCTITTGNSTTGVPLAPGRFRKTGSSASWSATYFGTPNRFWVSVGGMNMADQQVSTSAGDMGGTLTIANGLWYISARTALMGPGNYSVTGPNVLGDPHITTLDGVHYDFQGAGEFTLLRNESAGFEIQTRMSPVSTAAPLPPDLHTGLSSCPSINTAAAVRSRSHRISYQPGTGTRGASPRMLLRVDGRLVTVGPSGLALSDGTRLVRDRLTGELKITMRNQWGVRIVPHWWDATKRWYLDYDFTPATDASGVDGAIAPDSWLPALADGTSVGAMPPALGDRYDVLYRKFADSWRVTAATSLFDYSPGTSTGTFTNADWPGRDGRCGLPNTVLLQGVDATVAEQSCQGIFIPHFKRMCVLDVMVTGDRTFGGGYRLTQGPKRYSVRVPDSEPKGKE